MTRTNRKKTGSLFDQVFGRTFETIDPGEGKDPIKIDTTSIIHIPGVIKHWKSEIEARKKEILEFENRGFFDRLIDLVSGDEENDEASGDELYDISPTRLAEELMEQIEDDPTDMKKRLELVSLIGYNRKDLSVEMLRDLFLQATVACCFGELSNIGLNVVLKTQEAYLKKLLSLCRIDSVKLEKILDEPLTGNIFSKQRKEIEAYADKISRNMELIQFYIKFTIQGIQSLQTSFPIQITLSEIEELIVDNNESLAGKRKRVYGKANQIVSTLRYLILLHDEATKYTELLAKVDVHHPLPSVINARLQRARLLFLIHQHKVGDRTPQMYARIKERFKYAHQLYQAGIKKTEREDNHSLGAIIGIEYGKLIFDTFRFAKTVSSLEFPASKMEKYLIEAGELLSGLKGDQEVAEILRRIRESIAEFEE